MIFGKAFVGPIAARGALRGHPTSRRRSMMDEMWMRGWTENHGRFSADLDRGISQVAQAWRNWRARGARPAAPSKPRAGAH
ncbi:hypothetical protein LH20_16565 [Sphingopyxis sp. 113P3]|nr:hypothetical protein LH20_16565 [Sphingopyxis sp. 113P3]